MWSHMLWCCTGRTLLESVPCVSRCVTGQFVGMQGMMQELYQRGPITCGVATPDEFVYNHTWNGEVWQVSSLTVQVLGWAAPGACPC